MKILLLALFIGVYAAPSKAHNLFLGNREDYDIYKDAVINGAPVDTTSKAQQKVLVDVLWDLVAENQHTSQTTKRWNTTDYSVMDTPEKIRMFILGIKLNGTQSRVDFLRASVRTKLNGKLDKRSLIIIFNHTKFLSEQGLSTEIAQIHETYADYRSEYDAIRLSNSDVLNSDDVVSLMSKKQSQTTVYVMCRENREFGCAIAIKDKNGKLVEDFSLPLLAFTRLGLPFHFENGSTPAGVYFIDSVMPVADKQSEFGKNRRLILNFAGTEEVKRILPSSQLERKWWQQAQLAKELGRGYLRIHGTGVMNTDPHSLHPMLVPSVGCLKLREGQYDGVIYNDQRLLLNALMKAQGLAVKTENELMIKSTLILFHIPGKGQVTKEEIMNYISDTGRNL